MLFIVGFGAEDDGFSGGGELAGIVQKDLENLPYPLGVAFYRRKGGVGKFKFQKNPFFPSDRLEGFQQINQKRIRINEF